MPRRAAFVPLPAIVAIAACLGCQPEPPARVEPGSPVVARVDGEEVTQADLDRLSKQLAARRPGRAVPDTDDALEAWIQARLLREEVAARGLGEQDEYQARLAAIRARAWRSEQELGRSTLVSAIESGLVITEADLKARYDQNEQRFLTTRLHLRQITVPDRDTILGIRKQLAAGKAFDDLARQANLDPALRQKGGDLGWLEQRKLPTSVIGPAHRLVEPGEVTEPFRDREGRWNLVQLVASEKAASRSFESVRDQLERELRVIRSREALSELLDERRATLKIERVESVAR